MLQVACVFWETLVFSSVFKKKISYEIFSIKAVLIFLDDFSSDKCAISLFLRIRFLCITLPRCISIECGFTFVVYIACRNQPLVLLGCIHIICWFSV